ncbi:unnamed protein product [Acanthoscelides obtectus]|uniref:Uncharacterized protein n=1 Tax=Acanthoscelides obtectus TaxID=200917 RepID=A0A9P0PU94_ACAOB|nr:unnamed protein product [Acanthoscelides obtectus]CAK1657188.1 hypothetical protein AOBTE_LOCUS20188 [Acanthoscelides obtectus]
MKKVLRQHSARTITELRQKLQGIWDCFIPNFMPQRTSAVIK